MSSAYQKLLIFLLAILILACASSSLAFHMMCSAYKLNKQGDDIQPWCTPFPIWNQSVNSNTSQDRLNRKTLLKLRWVRVKESEKWKSRSHVRLFVIPWNSAGQNTGVGNLSLLQGIFPTQESNWGLLHCRRILYQLSYKEKKVKRVILQVWSLLRLPDVYTWKIGSLVPQMPSLQTSAENLEISS